MTYEWLIASAFVTGLLGSVHCVGMCGGIIGALSMTAVPEVRVATVARRVSYFPFAYNFGRVSSYTVAGLLAGGLGQSVLDATAVSDLTRVGTVIAGIFMVGLGLHLAGVWQSMALLERAGARLWRRIEPYGRRFLPARHAHQAFALGLVWGWLPCGMVYTVLAGALATGSTLHGGLVMLAFGLGTLPLLLAVTFGASGSWLRNQQAAWRPVVGILILSMGIYVMLHTPVHEHAENGARVAVERIELGAFYKQ